LGYVGILSPAVPGLAWGLVSGGSYAATQAVRTFGGQHTVATAQSTGTQVMGMGNISMGNHSIDNDTIAGSSILSSQMGHQASVVKGEATVKMLTHQMGTYGGARGYAETLANTLAIQDTQNIGAAGGSMTAAGGDWQNLSKMHEYLGAATTGGGGGMLAATGGDVSLVAKAASANAAGGTGTGRGKLDAANGSLVDVGNAGYAAGGKEYSGITGERDGAGGVGNLWSATYAASYGTMHGMIEAAKKRAELTGRGNWNAAIADHGIVRSFTEYAKTLGFEGYLKEVGFGSAAQAMTLGELQTHFDRIGTLAMGNLAGHDMSTKEGREQFYTEMATAKGVNIAVTDKNVGHINQMLAARGDSTRVKVGQNATIRGTADGKMTSIDAASGVTTTRSDVAKTTTGTRNEHGNKTTTFDNYQETYGGDVARYFNGRVITESGDSSHHFDNFRQWTGGYREQDFNVKESLSSTQKGGLEQTYYDPKTGAVVAGSQKNVITFDTAQDGGYATGAKYASTGDLLFTRTNFGDVRDRYMDRLNIYAGLASDGMLSHTARAGMMVGTSRDNAEAAILGAQTGAEGAQALGRIFMQYHAVGDALRMRFPNQYGPGTILGGPSGSPPTRISGGEYWKNYYDSFAP